MTNWGKSLKRRLNNLIGSKPHPRYSPLGSSEIRLLQFEKSSSQNDTIALRLNHYEMKTVPQYLALSYVWGASTQSRAVRVDGDSFPVTDNLHDALGHIRDLLSYLHEGLSEISQTHQTTPLFWIDAICIDQQNPDEKSREVPKMGQIYSKAATVLIWLGTIQDLQPDQAGFDFLLLALDVVLPLSNFSRPKLELDDGSGKGTSDDTAMEHLKIYGKILINDWFSRIWVLQEYCLSQRQPVALVGYALFPLEALSSYGPNLDQIANNPDPDIRKNLGSLALLIKGLAQVAFGPRYMPLYFKSPEFKGKSAAERLLWIYMNMGASKSTMPHDQIYGILGLIDMDTLPSELWPNYRLPYEQVCRSYTRYLINENRDLRILMFSSPPSLENEPSWVVDFRATVPWELEPRVAHPGYFTSDGLRLVIEGVKTGNIVRVILNDEGDTSHQLARLQNFHDEILASAAKMKQVTLHQIWQEWFAEFLEYTCGQTKDAVATASQYANVTEFLKTFKDGMEEQPDEIDRSRVISMFSSQNYALVDDGTIARCSLRTVSHRTNLSLEVWAFKGTMQRYVISPDNAGYYCYMGWLTEPNPHELDESFFSIHKVEQVTLG